jgi:HAD superfamily hydrolase (TIGR01509 family)
MGARVIIKNMKPKAIIFDLDGVLLDSENAWQSAIKRAVEELGGSWTSGQRALMERHLSPRGWSSYIKREAFLDEEASVIHNLVLDNLLSIYREDLPLIADAKKTVSLLSKKYTLALATGSDRKVVDTFLAESDLGDYFSVTLSAEDVTLPKPDPEIYKKALHMLGTRGSDTLAVEDSDAGIDSALAAGIPVACFIDEKFPPKEETLKKSSLVIREHKALQKLLLKKSDHTFAVHFSLNR